MRTTLQWPLSEVDRPPGRPLGSRSQDGDIIRSPWSQFGRDCLAGGGGGGMIDHPVGIAGAARLIFRGLPAAVALLLPALVACGGAKPGTSDSGTSNPA